MHRFIEILKSHPYAIGGGVLIGAFLIYMMSRSGTATGGTYTQPQSSEAELASINAQLVASQDATRMQGNLGALALQAKQADDATALSIAQNASATALAMNDNATALSFQQETDKANVSLLTLAASTALTSQQQGYSAELQAQHEYDSAGNALAANQADAYNKAYENGLWSSVASGGNGVGGIPFNIGVGKYFWQSVTAPDAAISAQQVSADQTIQQQTTAAAAVSNAALAAMYSATAHLTAPASSNPTAMPTST